MQSGSSQSSRPLHILDLPNEILGEICVYVRGAPYYGKESLDFGDRRYYCDGDQEAIKNTRLTCRKLYEASSHFLIPAISVSMTLSSLARLDQVSHHPWIATGVRTVRVVATLFARNLAEDLHFFILSQELKLHRARQLARSTAGSNVPDSSPVEDPDRASETIPTFLRAHEQYQRAFAEQEQMWTDGSFVRAVADAIARMPAARSLVFDDGPMTPQLLEPASFAQTMATPALFFASLVQPMSWAYAQRFNAQPPNGQRDDFYTRPIELWSQVPLAIHRAGVMLAHVDYNIAPTTNLSRLVGGSQDLEDLRVAMRQLRSFRIAWPRLPTREEHSLDDEEEMRRLRAFVEAFTDTDSIESISVDMRRLWPAETEPLMSAGGLLLTRAWPRLRRLRFSGPLELRDLETFLAQTQGRVALELHGAYLIRGTWSEAIDLVDANNFPVTIEGPLGVFAE